MTLAKFGCTGAHPEIVFEICIEILYKYKSLKDSKKLRQVNDGRTDGHRSLFPISPASSRQALAGSKK